MSTAAPLPTVLAGYLTTDDEVFDWNTDAWQRITAVKHSTRHAGLTITLTDGTRIPLGTYTPINARKAAR